jgi:hypothetical protein
MKGRGAVASRNDASTAGSEATEERSELQAASAPRAFWLFLAVMLSQSYRPRAFWLFLAVMLSQSYRLRAFRLFAAEMLSAPYSATQESPTDQ